MTTIKAGEFWIANIPFTNGINSKSDFMIDSDRPITIRTGSKKEELPHKVQFSVTVLGAIANQN